MTSEPSSPNPFPEPESPRPSDKTPSDVSPADLLPTNLKRMQFKGGVVAYAFAGILLSLLGLFLVTGLSNTPWLFLLYPVLIGVLFVSLSAIALHLLHRF